MDDFKHHYLELKSRWKEYYELQEQLRKNRRIIYITSCQGFLLIGFIVGMLVFSRQEVIVGAGLFNSKSEVQTIRL